MARHPDPVFPQARPARAILAAVLACALEAQAGGACPKRILPLGTLGGTFSQARGINESGVNGEGLVVGYGRVIPGEFRAFAWRRGALAWLAVFGGGADVSAVSENGLIVGQAATPEGWHAVIWDRRGRATDLGTLPGGGFSSAAAVNGSGVVAGLSGTGEEGPDAVVYQAVIWR